MNVQELLEALQRHDPATSALDALTVIQAEAEKAARERLLTPAGMRAVYADVIVATKTHKDSDGSGNAPEHVELIAYNSVRSLVHAALEHGDPQPGPHPDDEGDPDLHWARQKRHGMKLWQKTEALVAAAGITAKGLVS